MCYSISICYDGRLIQANYIAFNSRFDFFLKNEVNNVAFFQNGIPIRDIEVTGPNCQIENKIRRSCNHPAAAGGHYQPVQVARLPVIDDSVLCNGKTGPGSIPLIAQDLL